ncbi:restriction endonuclease [Streptomyces sp. FB2]|uniref:restriction endonuclease n=1 Tax=Streptomyces sp. FB2 TaxID=2902454 RepID=UPI001F2B28E1|nr:restriction endonuclease [Streptomyces sp. FB2]MCF2534102.1 restriction endonuclease [Streptomyces sp. FB2]
MTVPAPRDRRLYGDRRFDMRTTTLFFVLLALVLCLVASVGRIVMGMVERRPEGAGLLAVLIVASVLASRSRWRRLSAARCARRAAKALEAAAETASDNLRDMRHTAAEEGMRGTAAAEGVRGAAAAMALPAVECPAGAADPAFGYGADPLRPEVPPAPNSAAAAGEKATAVLDLPVDCFELDPDAFERTVADLCLRDGCGDVKVVGGAGDLGADVTAVTPDGRRLIVQCKRYCETNKVGSQDLQRFGGTCFTVHEADIAVVVTTSDFTAPALEYAAQCGILCVNGDELSAWHDGAGPRPWDFEVTTAP